MRYGILSDIHGNLEALDAVLDRLSTAGVSSYLCLGDVVGYGADPNACCERVRALPGLCVVGNHDLAAIGAFDLRWFNAYACAAAEWTERELRPENRSFLAALPEVAWGVGFQLVHGSPIKPTTGYVTDAFEATAALEAQKEPLCFVGHTHVPMAFSCRQGGLLCAAVPFRVGQAVLMEAGYQYLVNCGGVGQPRDGNPRAACGVYDTDAGTVELLRVSYDIAAAQAKMRAAGLPPILADRLAFGR